MTMRRDRVEPKSRPFPAAVILLFLSIASPLWALEIYDGTGNNTGTATVNDRFSSGYTSTSVSDPTPNTSPDFLAAGYDLSGIGWNSARPTQSVTLVSSQYFLEAEHFQVPVGGSVTFVNEAGVLKTYSVINHFDTFDSGKMSDMELGEFSAPIPSSDGIAPFPILNLGSDANYINLPLLVYGATAKFGTNTITAIFDQDAEGSTTQATRVLQTDFTSTINSAQAQSGDSGSAAFAVSSGKLAVVGTIYGTNDADTSTLDAFAPYYVGQLDNSMAATGASLMLIPEPQAWVIVLLSIPLLKLFCFSRGGRQSV